jgi:hypothetical protein
MTPKTDPSKQTAAPATDVDGVAKTAWIPLDPETDRGEHGLTPLILHRLSHKVSGQNETIAQLVTQSLLDRALDGHFGALEEILSRIDGDAKARDPAARSTNASVEIDIAKAQRILHALDDQPEGPPGD